MFKSVFHSIRDHAFLIFHYEMPASDHCLLALYSGRNTVCHNIFYFGMHLFMNKVFFSGSIDHSPCHRMRKMFFHTCCNTQKFIGAQFIVKGYYICNYRFCLCKGTCFVKYDGGGISHRFHIFAAFYCNAMGICLPDGR